MDEDNFELYPKTERELLKPKKTIEDCQRLLRIMAEESRKGWKANADRKVEDIPDNELPQLFS